MESLSPFYNLRHGVSVFMFSTVLAMQRHTTRCPLFPSVHFATCATKIIFSQVFGCFATNAKKYSLGFAVFLEKARSVFSCTGQLQQDPTKQTRQAIIIRPHSHQRAFLALSGPWITQGEIRNLSHHQKNTSSSMHLPSHLPINENSNFSFDKNYPLQWGKNAVPAMCRVEDIIRESKLNASASSTPEELTARRVTARNLFSQKLFFPAKGR